MDGADSERKRAGFKERTPVDEARRILKEAVVRKSDTGDGPVGTATRPTPATRSRR